MAIRSTLISLLTLLSVVAAGNPETFEICTTHSGASSVANVPTTVYAYTQTFHAKKYSTLTPTVTVTPFPVPATSTVSTTTLLTTTITLPQVTDTFTTTTTLVTSTITTLSFSTTTTTTVESTSDLPAITTTIEPPAGFTPLGVSDGDQPAKKARQLVHAPRNTKSQQTQVHYFPQDGKIVCSPTRYPVAVTCGALVLTTSTSTKTLTAKQTFTSTVPQSTVTTTTTISDTLTLTATVMDASTTITASTTLTLTDTVSTTTTTTDTATETVTVQPEATYYAACASNNIIGVVQGEYGIADVESGSSSGSFESFQNSAYDCCVSCITNPSCAVSYSFGTGCYFFTETTCNPSTQVATLTYVSGFQNFIIASNGVCGQYANGAFYG